MSITYFPKLHPDELVYSVLARFYVHGGFTNQKYAYEQLFVNPKIRVEKEFVKNLKPEVIDLLTKDSNFEELIEKHTMYPCYGRFIDCDRRKIAYEALVNMSGDFSKLFGVPNNRKGEQRFLKFCPLCVREDRERLSETYWHRFPQMRGNRVCPLHQCYLEESSVSLDSRVVVNLVTAEEVIPSGSDIVMCNQSAEIRLAEFMQKVFEAPTGREAKLLIKKFFQARLKGTSYLSSRGEHRYFHKLWEDMNKLYSEVPIVNTISTGNVQRILSGERIVFEEICMIAMFLNISAEELIAMEAPNKSPEEEFDEMVLQLISSGKGINEVARELGVASSMVRMVRVISDKEPSVNRNRGKIKSIIDWDKIDEETLPKVKEAIKELQGGNGDRPKRISKYAVAKWLHIGSHRFDKMEKCRTEIEQHCQTEEQYAARKVKWASETLIEQELPISCWRLCHMTKVEREGLIACIPELRQIAPPELASRIEALL